jgi:hypothetical protein
MGSLPEKHKEQFDIAYRDAKDRLVSEFKANYCCEDGSIDWVKLVRKNSGR